MHKHKAVSIFTVKISSPWIVFLWSCLTSLYFLGKKKLFYSSRIKQKGERKRNNKLSKMLDSVRLIPISIVFLLVLIFLTLHSWRRTWSTSARRSSLLGSLGSFKLTLDGYLHSVHPTLILFVDETAHVPGSILTPINTKLWMHAFNTQKTLHREH